MGVGRASSSQVDADVDLIMVSSNSSRTTSNLSIILIATWFGDIDGQVLIIVLIKLTLQSLNLLAKVISKLICQLCWAVMLREDS